MSSIASLLVLEERGQAVSLTLPPADTDRWSPRRKAAVVVATRHGVLSRAEACARYRLSPEELASWEAALDENGIPGLRTTRQQIYRMTASIAKARRARLAFVASWRAEEGDQAGRSKRGPSLAAAG